VPEPEPTRAPADPAVRDTPELGSPAEEGSIPAYSAPGDGPPPPSLSAEERAERTAAAKRDAFLIGVGWLGTNLGLQIPNLPFKLLLKEELGLAATAVSSFLLIAHLPSYIKPLFGILTDAVPMAGTRRRSYLLTSLVAGGAFWLLLAVVPRTWHLLLWTYLFLYAALNLISTVLGGLMVEVGKRHHNTGQLSAQRVGITRFIPLIADPLGGLLAKTAFIYTASIAAFLHWILVPLFWLKLREPRAERGPGETLAEVKRQGRALVTSRDLWAAAGLVVLVVAAPGFETALLYHQRDQLGFDQAFIGALGMMKGLGAIAGAALYSVMCRRMPLRLVMTLTIVIHGALTLLYLGYRTPLSAILITGIDGTTMVLALLPLYDLAIRATPRGSEALGYSVLMSVWNLTNGFSDYGGSWLYRYFNQHFEALVWVNTITTIAVIVFIPLLPGRLMNRKDGEPEPGLDAH